MVGFVPLKNQQVERNEKLIKDQCLSEIYDFSLPLTDCSLDFDPIKEWLEEDPLIGPLEYSMEGYDGGDVEKVEALGVVEQENVKNGCPSIRMGIEKGCLSDESVKVGSLVGLVQESGGIGKDVAEKESKEVAFLIEEELKRVSLDSELNGSVMVGSGGSKIGSGVVGNEADVAKIEIPNVKEEVGGDKDENGSESESESESGSESSGSSSSSSSLDTSSDEGDDDEDEESKSKIETDMEEGEIVGSEAEEMVAWSDGEDEDCGNAMKGPIRSKNEIADLPPVPDVKVSLEPHHHTLPVGIILSIMDRQVIVEGVETHNPLSEGSILWITESRSPLGIVDEIFGPVKNPYYIVRYNSETEVPAGVQAGTQISFVPEFADHILNNANLYRKGYDASGENDEELSEEAEFSDDEKEAEYKKMKKMKKRGPKDGKGGEDRKVDRRKSNNRFGVEKHEQSIANQTANNVSTQHFVQSPGVSSGTRPVFSSGLAPGHPLPQLGSSAPTPNNVYLNGNPSPQTGGSAFPMNPQMQGMAWLQGNHPQPQTPFLNMAPFQQNIQMNPSLAANLAAMAGQPNFGPGPAFSPFPGCMAPNFFNQPLFGMGMQGNALTQTNFGANAVSASQLQHGSVAQNFLNQSILAMGMQGQNASTSTNVGMGMQGQNSSTSASVGMGMQGQNASTSTNVGANAVSSNGFQSMGTFNPGQGDFQNFNHGGHDGSQNFNHDGQDGSQNFNHGGQDGSQNYNPGTHRGRGRRPYNRGGGRFRGGRGRRTS